MLYGNQSFAPELICTCLCVLLSTCSLLFCSHWDRKLGFSSAGSLGAGSGDGGGLPLACESDRKDHLLHYTCDCSLDPNTLPSGFLSKGTTFNRKVHFIKMIQLLWLWLWAWSLTSGCAPQFGVSPGDVRTLDWAQPGWRGHLWAEQRFNGRAGEGRSQVWGERGGQGRAHTLYCWAEHRARCPHQSNSPRILRKILCSWRHYRESNCIKIIIVVISSLKTMRLDH